MKLNKRLQAASRRLDKATKQLRAGRIAHDQYDAIKAEYVAIGEQIMAEQLTGLAEAHLERDQLAWSEGNIGRRW